MLLRAPAVIADRRQLPISIVLALLAFGSITIQSWFGRAVNEFTGITALNNLIQGLSGIASQAVPLEFIILTYRNTNGASRLRVLRISLAFKKQLIGDEITRLMSGDIPTFHSRPGSTTLESDRGTRYEAFYDAMRLGRFANTFLP